MKIYNKTKEGGDARLDIRSAFHDEISSLPEPNGEEEIRLNLN